MSDLAQALQSLSQMAALIPTHVGNLAQELSATRSAVDELVHAIQDKQNQATTVLAQLQATFQEFEQEVNQHQIQVDQDINEVETGVDTLEKFIAEARNESKQELEVLHQKLIGFKTLLETSQNSTEIARNALQSASTEFHNKLQTDQSQIESTVTSVSHEIEGFGQQLESVKSSTGQHIEQLQHTLEQVQAETGSKVQGLVQHCNSVGNDLTTHLINVGHSCIQESVDSLLNEGQQKITDTLHPLVDRATGCVVEAIESISEDMKGDASHMSGGRRLIEAAIHEVKPLIEPVKQGIESCKQAFEKVGLSL